MNKIRLLSLNEITDFEFYDGQISESDIKVLSFCYNMCTKLVQYIETKINLHIFYADIDQFFYNNYADFFKFNLEEIVYFDDIIFQSGLCFVEDCRIREIVFNYLFSLHASLRRGKPTRVETFTYFVK